MTAVLIYCALALLIIVAVVFLVRSRRADTIHGAEVEPNEVRAFWEGSELNLAERIFDRSDYLWLRDEAGFPALAKKLRRSRTHMALAWLRAVRKSFDKLVRMPAPVPTGHDLAAVSESWGLLRLTLRFHLVLLYAFLVVRLFGPYHRLVPSFGWMPTLSGRTSASKPYESPGTQPFA